MKQEFCISFKDEEIGIDFSYKLDSTENGEEIIRALYTAMVGMTFHPNTVFNLMNDFVAENDNRETNVN